MNQTDRFIASCSSWEKFDQGMRKLSKNEQGRNFERLVQLYLQNEPEYRTSLREVWLLREVPADVRNAINLPYLDEGIDLIARDQYDKYWAIQAKYRTQQDRPLSRRALGTFHALASNTCRNITLAVVAHTCTKPVSKRHLMRDTVEIGLDRWQSADWSLIVRSLNSTAKVRLKARQPRDDQKRAIAAAKQHFIEKKAARGRMIMPCGTGKSLTAFWIAEAIKASTIVVAVPSLGLIRQSVADWTREFLAKGEMPSWICVCSDDSVGNLERDEFVGEKYDTGLPTFTNPKEIAELLLFPGKIKIVFTTYQSGDRLAAAAKLAGVNFDLVICDEAHRTVGARSKSFAALLHDRTLKARYRLFMTATERRVNGDTDVFSMDDNEADYGARFFTMTFKEAIDLGIISDYEILTITVSDREVNDLITRNRLLNLHQNLDEAEARAVATGIALKQVYKKYHVKHAISFHASIRGADRFREQQDVLNCLPPSSKNFHISSRKSAGERKLLLDEFKAAPRALMTNARCLTEGIDVPAIDCVVFADPKQSATDVVQASGRAMRNAEGKTCGYIVVPIVVPEGMEFGEFAATTAFKTVTRIITALSVSDTRLVDELHALHYGRVPSGKIIKIEGKVPVGMHMSLERFADAVSTKMWESVARVHWRPFTDAREFAQKIGLKSKEAWVSWCKIPGNKPADIPADPRGIYADEWKGWGDWLGTGNRKDVDWRPFTDARQFACNLGLKAREEWVAWGKTPGNRPADIPANPNSAYADEWKGWGDWLGTGNGKNVDWRPFTDAREFVRKLGLKSEAGWRVWNKTPDRPADIPANPSTVYANEWQGWGDFLGTGNPRLNNVGRRPFAAAREFARKLGLKSQKEWFTWCKIPGNRPLDIPASPDAAYANEGWAGYGDFLGTGNLKNGDGDYCSFAEASAHVQRLGIKSFKKFKAWKERPADIPATPNSVYANDWKGWPHFLGTTTRCLLPYDEVSTFVREHGIKSELEWRVFRRMNKLPNNIPADPARAYANSGWTGWPAFLGTRGRANSKNRWPLAEARALMRKLKFDNVSEFQAWSASDERPLGFPSAPPEAYDDQWKGWGWFLGTGRISNHQREFRPFADARAFAQNLNLKGKLAWDAYCKSGKKPNDIPSNPQMSYANAGWMGWSDWLGYGRRVGHWRSFKEARAFVRALKLKNESEWRDYCKSGRKPQDIPTNPKRVYANADWLSLSDWLGSKWRRGGWRSFEDARAFARTLKLNGGKAWRAHCKSGKSPQDIPANPNTVYANAGWVSWGDWLNTKRRIGGWRSFEDARAFVHSLELKNQKGWRIYVGSAKKPHDIPSKPDFVYADAGWMNWSDWLNTKRKTAEGD